MSRFPFVAALILSSAAYAIPAVACFTAPYLPAHASSETAIPQPQVTVVAMDAEVLTADPRHPTVHHIGIDQRAFVDIARPLVVAVAGPTVRVR